MYLQAFCAGYRVLRKLVTKRSTLFSSTRSEASMPPNQRLEPTLIASKLRTGKELLAAEIYVIQIVRRKGGVSLSQTSPGGLGNPQGMVPGGEFLDHARFDRYHRQLKPWNFERRRQFVVYLAQVVGPAGTRRV